jgi:hypothetical protein
MVEEICGMPIDLFAMWASAIIGLLFTMIIQFVIGGSDE